MALVDKRSQRIWKLAFICVVFWGTWKIFFKHSDEKVKESGFVQHIVDIQDIAEEQHERRGHNREEANPSLHNNGMEDNLNFEGREFSVSLPGGFEVMRMVDESWVTDPAVCETREKFPVSKLRTPTGYIKISLYSEGDHDDVSDHIRTSGEYQYDVMNTLYHIIHKHPQWVFIDIGAHIGAHSLAIAKAGYDVIALEPLVPNIQRFCRSLELGEYRGIVRVIHNAVSDSLGNIAVKNNKGRQSTEQTVMLDELAILFLQKSVILRIDTGEHQLAVLQGATEFFKHVNVKYVLMDFPKDVQNTKEGNEMIKFLTEMKMKPAKPDDPSKSLNLSGTIDWPETVLWIKQVP